MNDSQNLRMKYTPALDGLRAIAILSVVLFHAWAPFASGGFVGVDLFFVLSGFLITSLLLQEQRATGKVDLPAFYRRRFMRLMPALAFMLAAYALLAPMLWPGKGHWIAAVIAGAYLSDYAYAMMVELPRQIRHTWSLAVEMHFYLLWPLALGLTAKRFTPAQLHSVLFAVYVIACLWRAACAFGQDWNLVYFRFDTRLPGLLLGAWLASVVRDPAALAVVAIRLPRLRAWIFVLVVCAALFAWEVPLTLAVGLLFVEWCGVALVLACLSPNSRLANPAAVFLGTLSYGIYLWHFPIFYWLRERMSWELTLLIGLPISIAIAWLSFVTIERWAKRMRSPSRSLLAANAVER